jgi:hypothetical protein
MNIKSTIAAIACVCVFSFAALPEIRINTQGGDPQRQNDNGCGGGGGLPGWGMGGGMLGPYKYPYIKVTDFRITDPNDRTNETTRTSKLDSLRLRGNSTSGNDKKPYRIKFEEKVSIFGKEKAKSWVLLANYYDGTFALNAMAFEMGKRMGLEFTNSSQLVDLYINNQYKGIYQLTEQIQSNPGRVDLKEKKNGWLAEFDYHDPASDECLNYFSTGSNRYNLTTFIKSPELDDTSFTKNPTDSMSLRFVKNDIMKLVDKMAETGFPDNGYRDLIDLESFAKYVLIQLVMDNFDFNSKTQQGGLPGSNFAYKVESCGKIKAGPLWDFDLAAGVQNNQSGCWQNCPPGFPSHYQSYQDPVTPTSQNYSHAFYKRLWEDPVFKAKYKKAWDTYKSQFQSMDSFIETIKSQVEGSITGKGNNIWANNSMNGSGTLTQQQFNTEVQNLKTWWNNRLNWVDQQLSSLSTSADIQESTPVCNTSSSSKNSSSSQASGGGSSSSQVSGGSSSSVNSNSVTLSCTNLQSNVAKGGTIAEPTLTCSNGSTPTDQNWFGRPSGNTSWTTNAQSTTTSYTIRVTARCGSVTTPEVTCGTVAVGTTPIKPIALPQIASISRISLIKNGVNLQVQKSARLEIYNLRGRLEKTMNFTSGVYNVPLGDLPKGMYIAQAVFGSEKKILRISVM